jgi:hypothetical protein
LRLRVAAVDLRGAVVTGGVTTAPRTISREPETERVGALSAQNPMGRREIEKRRGLVSPTFFVNWIGSAVRRPLDQLPERNT